ncbi:MAG: hypothetical protein HYX35_01425 [Proteobacteria bacterium]|nr:hypothetical protein [Pseudomonadota bacterium]
MKKNIFTLLVTASILAATPVFAMDDSDPQVVYATAKSRPAITNKTADLTDPTVVDDLETYGTLIRSTDEGLEVFEYDDTTLSTDNLVSALRSASIKTWTDVDHQDDTITFELYLSKKAQTSKNLTTLLFNKIDTLTDPKAKASSTVSSSPKKASPSHSRSNSSSSDEEVTTTAKAITLSNPAFLPDWVDLGLIKTNPIVVKEGQTLTVTCEFDEATEVTEISFLNSAQNGYYSGGVTVQPGEKKATFTSVVPTGETQAWLLIRNPGFNGTDKLALGVNLTDLNIEIKD